MKNDFNQSIVVRYCVKFQIHLMLC